MTVSAYQHVVDRQRAVRALGHPLKREQPIHHHFYGWRGRRYQLVICDSVAYHALLHQRTSTLRLDGDPNYERLCSWCLKLRPLAGFRATRCEWCVSTNAAAGGWFEQPRRGRVPIVVMLPYMARIRRETGKPMTAKEIQAASKSKSPYER